MSIPCLIKNNIILGKICDFLHPTHLLQCILVSKEWRYYFTPRLWSVIDLNRQYIDSISAFHHNQEFNSKPINLPKLQHINKDVVPEFPLLRNGLVKVYQSDISSWSISHIELLSSLINIWNFCLLIPFTNPTEPIYKIPDVLKGFVGLRRLDIIILTYVQTDLLHHFISSAYHCESFHVTINLDTTDPQQIVNLRNSIEKLPITKFQDLKIKTIATDIDLMISAPLLKKSPQMTCFYLCEPYTCETLQQVSNILLDDSHHQLKYVGVEEAVNHRQDYSEYWDALRCFFRNVSYKFMNSDKRTILCFKQAISPQARRKEGDDPQRYRFQEDIMLNVYPRCFSDTVTSLELERLSIPSFIVLLCRLPLLLNLRASVFQSPQNSYTPNTNSINFQEAPLFTSMFASHVNTHSPVDDNLMTALGRVSWVCTGIKSIKLWIRYICMRDYVKALLVCLFENLGKLHQLEELNLGAESGILTTSTMSVPRVFVCNDFPGFLLLLNDLKLLSCVNLRNYGVKKARVDVITLKDIKFMIDSWPKLQHLTLQGRCLQASERDEITDITARRGIEPIIFDDIVE